MRQKTTHTEREFLSTNRQKKDEEVQRSTKTWLERKKTPPHSQKMRDFLSKKNMQFKTTRDDETFIKDGREERKTPKSHVFWRRRSSEDESAEKTDLGARFFVVGFDRE